MQCLGKLRAAAGWIVLVALMPCVTTEALAAEPAKPRLVVLLAVDQLHRERLSAALPGGLGRLVREGQVHVDAVLDHATTETCPGHVSMLSGRHPGPAGAPTNSYIDLESGERRYCVEDRAADAAVLRESPDDPTLGRSPRNLRADALGDWMKAADSRSRAFSVSAKDRSAIALGGRQPDGVYWLLRGERPGFTTSRYYRASLPGWAEAWNAVDFAERIPERWEHPSEAAPEAPGRIDDYEGESDERSRTSPHPLWDSNVATLVGNVYRSPFVDEWTLSFAGALVEAEGLGAGPQPDLLAISLSGTDTVGHAYGPDSLEARDALRRVDAWVGDFLAMLEARVGRDQLLVVLTADHGVLPLPEWLEERGRLECPLPGGRQGLISLVFGLYWELHWELSPLAWPQAWMDASSQLSVNRALARERDVPVERVVALAEKWLEDQPSIREAWTRREIEGGVTEMSRLYRNSFDPEKSGDLAVQFEPTCLPDFEGSGTSHGSPYGYDREVPIVFWGNGIRSGRVLGNAATVDIAPSLADRLGIATPEPLDGRSLLSR